MRSGWIIRTLGLAALVAVAVTANAFAGGRAYEGSIDSDYSATVSLKVKKSDHARWVTSFVARNFIISCEAGVEARLGSAQVRAKPGTIRVRQAFRRQGREGPEDGRDQGPLHEPGRGERDAALQRADLGRRRRPDSEPRLRE